MKKILIISGAISILLVLLGIWIYMLLINEPDSNGGVFTNLNFFADQDTTPMDITPLEDPVTQVNVGSSALRQLTTRPVIGFTEVFSTTTAPFFVTYAESGTGHLYQINMETGEEQRISNTTIPNASQAEISPTGATVAIRSGFSANSTVVIGTVTSEGTLDNQPLSVLVADMAFANTGNLLYAEPTINGLRAQQFNPTTRETNTLFEVPFQAAQIIWSKDGIAPYYVYNKPSAKLRGYVYAVTDGKLLRQPIAGYGITAIANTSFISYNQLFTTEYSGLTYSPRTNETTPTPILTIPEKCAFQSSTSNILYCGYDITTYDFEFPDSWYKGIESFSDRLWEINLAVGTAQQLVNPVQQSGREIDVINMTASSNTSMLYFINKHDNTLWSYER